MSRDINSGHVHKEEGYDDSRSYDSDALDDNICDDSDSIVSSEHHEIDSPRNNLSFTPPHHDSHNMSSNSPLTTRSVSDRQSPLPSTFHIPYDQQSNNSIVEEDEPLSSLMCRMSLHLHGVVFNNNNDITTENNMISNRVNQSAVDRFLQWLCNYNILYASIVTTNNDDSSDDDMMPPLI